MPLIQPVFLEAAVLLLGLMLLLLEAFANERDKKVFAWCGIAGLTLVLVCSFFIQTPPAGAPTGLWRFYQADTLAMFFKRFALLTTIFVLVMSIDYSRTLTKLTHGAENQAGLGEFYTLPVLACAGLMWMVSAVDFIMIFVSLELVTISFYVLVAYMRRSAFSLEAGVKYLILGALSTGFLVYGITWIYGVTGQTNLAAISKVLAAGGVHETGLLFGLLLVIVALGFKIAAVPFHIWVPDVYQGAPTPVTAFLSVGSKAAGFVVLMRVLDAFTAAPAVHAKAIQLMGGLAVLTLIFGNLAALPQTNLKRLLAYSSIAQAGYLLVGVSSVAGVAVSFYLGGYLLMTLLGFMVLILVADAAGGDDIAHFKGLAKRSPVLAFGMLISMLSLAGLPFTVGFFGKFFIFAAAVGTRQYGLVAVGAVAVVCGFYYYLKVVRAMFWQEGDSVEPIPVAPLTKWSMVLMIALIFLLGVYPEPVIAMLR